MKWSLVIAGISDLARPAEKLSLTQNLALMATGTIWTRWCFIISPRNILYVYAQKDGEWNGLQLQLLTL